MPGTQKPHEPRAFEIEIPVFCSCQLVKWAEGRLVSQMMNSNISHADFLKFLNLLNREQQRRRCIFSLIIMAKCLNVATFTLVAEFTKFTLTQGFSLEEGSGT